MRQLKEIEKETIRNDTEDFDRKFDHRKELFLELRFDDSEAEQLSWYSFCCNDIYSTFELFLYCKNKFNSLSAVP